MSAMDLLMCLDCGEFVQAIPEDGNLVPIRDDCPKCGGGTFKDNASGEIVRTDD